MRRRILAGFIVAGTVAIVAAPAQLPRDFARVNAVAALDAYEAGEFDQAVDYLQRVADWVGGLCNSGVDAALYRAFEVFAHRFGQHAGTWILAVPQAERPRRRQIAAVVALEIGHVAPRFWGSSRACVSWAEARVSVEWACQMLRSAGPPTSFERLWHLAAMALIERAQDTVFMSGGSPSRQRERDHAGHAIERFPDEPRFRLAPLLARAEVQYIAREPGAPLTSIPQTVARANAVERRRIDETLAALDAFTAADAAVTAEAKLRAGVLRFGVGDVERSLGDFQVAAFGADPFARSVAGALTARIYEGRGERERAIEALRQVVDADPRGHWQRMRLSAALRASGSIAEADVHAEAALGELTPSDPSRDYAAADYRFWPRYLETLRATVNR